MSQRYEMRVEIIGFDPKRQSEIEDAANAEWSFGEWEKFRNGKKQIELDAYGESSLAGGEGEEEFASRLAKAVMKANGKACEVQVFATFLEDLPCELYSFDEDDYKELMS
jgi:hypothetical protein